MAVLRIVPSVAADWIDEAAAFYRDLLGLDHGSGVDRHLRGELHQIGFAVEGGSGTPVPDVSIEVGDVDDVYGRAIRADFEIPYGTEPWRVRRFFLRDSFGKIVNVRSHSTAQETGGG